MNVKQKKRETCPPDIQRDFLIHTERLYCKLRVQNLVHDHFVANSYVFGEDVSVVKWEKKRREKGVKNKQHKVKQKGEKETKRENII